MTPITNGQRLLLKTDAKLAEVAEVAGVSIPTASRWKNGVGMPSAEQRNRLFVKWDIHPAEWDKIDGDIAGKLPKKRRGRPAKEAKLDEPAKPAKLDEPVDEDDEERPVERRRVAPVASSYPKPPTSLASTLESARYALECVRHDIRNGRDLTTASLSKLRSEEMKWFGMIVKMERDAELSESRYVREHPAFQSMCKRILEALRNYPEASRAVIVALGAE